MICSLVASSERAASPCSPPESCIPPGTKISISAAFDAHSAKNSALTSFSATQQTVKRMALLRNSVDLFPAEGAPTTDLLGAPRKPIWTLAWKISRIEHTAHDNRKPRRRFSLLTRPFQRLKIAIRACTALATCRTRIEFEIRRKKARW